MISRLAAESLQSYHSRVLEYQAFDGYPEMMTADYIRKDSFYTLNNGSKIPISGFGVYKTPADETIKITYEALKAGYRHVDSAQGYFNELEVAKDAYHGYEEASKAIQDSLTKVGPYIEYIDLFLIHSPLSNKEKRLGTWKALQEAVDPGKVKSIGVSNYGTHHSDELLSWEGLKYKPAINQIKLHPWLPRKDLQAYSKKYDHLLEAYAPINENMELLRPKFY